MNYVGRLQAQRLAQAGFFPSARSLGAKSRPRDKAGSRKGEPRLGLTKELILAEVHSLTELRQIQAFTTAIIHQIVQIVKMPDEVYHITL